MTTHRETKALLELKYPPGTVVELKQMGKEPQMPCGLTGIVQFIDDAFQIHVAWDNGSSLALIPGLDSYSILQQTPSVPAPPVIEPLPELTT